jgi:alpha-methylacyl-CoA racemase
MQDEVRATFAATFAARDRDEWVSELAPQDTCVAPVLAVSEVPDRFAHLIREATHPDHGSFRQLGPLVAGSNS